MIKMNVGLVFSLSKKISPQKHLHLICCFEPGQVSTGADSKIVNFDKSQVH
jgi:hypothetical protein